MSSLRSSRSSLATITGSRDSLATVVENDQSTELDSYGGRIERSGSISSAVMTTLLRQSLDSASTKKNFKTQSLRVKHPSSPMNKRKQWTKRSSIADPEFFLSRIQDSSVSMDLNEVERDF